MRRALHMYLQIIFKILLQAVKQRFQRDYDAHAQVPQVDPAKS